MTDDKSPTNTDWILSVTTPNVQDGLASMYRVNGKNLKIKSEDQFQSLPNKLCINCYKGGSERSDFQLAEIMVVIGTFTMADIDVIETYFANKYGLTMDKDWKPSCASCDQGKYYDKISGSCLSCPAGTSTPAAGSVGSSSCALLCLPGSYSANGLNPVETPCTPCEEGKFQQYPGKTSCHAPLCTDSVLAKSLVGIKIAKQFSAEDLDKTAKNTLFDRANSVSPLNAVSGTPGACKKSLSTAGSNGATTSFPIITGNLECKLVFTDKQYDNGYIVAHLARYSGNLRQRVLTSGEKNWLSGHFGYKQNQCFHEGSNRF